LSGGRTISPAHLMFDDAAMDEQAMPSMATLHAEIPAPVEATSVYAAMPVAPIILREEPAAPVNLDSAVKASELQVIMAAIQSTDSRLEAAAKLGISPRTLRYKLAQMRTREMSEGASA